MTQRKIEKEAQRFVNEVNPYLGREGLIYARVSSKRQETDGSGLDSQEERCLRDLKSIEVPYKRTFPDTFTGGGDFMKRPAMSALLSYIDSNPHKKYVVIFDDLSRFARDVTFHIKLRAEFKARDVVLRCLNYNFDDSPEGEYIELMFAGSAELHRKQNRRQVIQKMKSCLERGYWPFAGRRGYELVKDPLIGKRHIPDKDGLLMKSALDGFATRKFLRPMDVTRYLFEKGFWKHTKKNRPPEKYVDEVTKILKDVFHAGYIEYPEWDVARRKGIHEGLISIQTFELIQDRLRKGTSHARVRVDISSEFSLRGLLLCPECNQKLTGAFSKGRTKSYPYYYCMTKGCSLRSKMIPRDKAERDFRELLQRNRLKEDTGSVIGEIFDRVWKEEVEALRRSQTYRRQLQNEKQNKVRDLTELVRTAKSDVLKKTYERQLEEVAKEISDEDTEQKTDLKTPYRTALTKAVTLLEKPVSIWDSVDTAEKHRLFFFIFEEKLSYSKTDGYRTADSLSTTRLFEEFSDENSVDVDHTGLEPVTSPMPWARSTR